MQKGTVLFSELPMLVQQGLITPPASETFHSLGSLAREMVEAVERGAVVAVNFVDRTVAYFSEIDGEFSPQVLAALDVVWQHASRAGQVVPQGLAKTNPFIVQQHTGGGVFSDVTRAEVLTLDDDSPATIKARKLLEKPVSNLSLSSLIDGLEDAEVRAAVVVCSNSPWVAAAGIVPGAAMIFDGSEAAVESFVAELDGTAHHGGTVEVRAEIVTEETVDRPWA